MGRFFDFAVKHNFETESQEALTKKILYSLIIRRLKGKKPTVIFMGGDSGEGKSYSALKFQEILLSLQGLDLKDYLEDINVFTPLQYPVKLNRILGLEKHDKDLKKIRFICMHEARDIVKAKNWHKFLNQAIADVNAMSRSIKRLCFIVVSQFIRDISVDIRYTLTYYITVTRPIGKRARLNISVIWKDDSDLEKPRMRKRRLKGYIIDDKGRRKLITPKYLELGKPDKEVTQRFDKLDFESKAKVIRSKTDKLIQEMKAEFDLENKKVKGMVKWYIENPESLTHIGKRYRGKWKVKPDIKLIHDLTDSEAKDFETKLNEGMKNKGLLAE